MNKEEILKAMVEQMPFTLNPSIEPYILEAMQMYATSQTETLKKELKFCLDIIDKYVDDFRLSQKDIDRLKLLLETF